MQITELDSPNLIRDDNGNNNDNYNWQFDSDINSRTLCATGSVQFRVFNLQHEVGLPEFIAGRIGRLLRLPNAKEDNGYLRQPLPRASATSRIRDQD